MPRASTATSVAVIGVGNILMADDGVGVAVIEALKKEPLPAGTELYDAGTALNDVLALIQRRDRVILVDSCKSGGQPGSIYRSHLRLDEWENTPLGDSLHDINLLDALQMHRLAGGQIGELILIGVEPKQVTLHMGLSPALRERLPEIVQAVRNELVTPPKTRRGGIQ